MFSADGNLDLSELDRAIETTEQRAKRLGPAFRELRKPMRGDQRDHAKAQRGPDGAWPARSPITEERRRGRNRGVRTTAAMRTVSLGKFRKRSTPKKILGRIPQAVVTTVGELYVRTRSLVKWSRAHQLGLRVGSGVTLKARRFLWLGEQLIRTANEVLVNYVAKGMKK